MQEFFKGTVFKVQNSDKQKLYKKPKQDEVNITQCDVLLNNGKICGAFFETARGMRMHKIREHN